MKSVLMLFAMLAWFNVCYKNRADVTKRRLKQKETVGRNGCCATVSRNGPSCSGRVKVANLGAIASLISISNCLLPL